VVIEGPERRMGRKNASERTGGRLDRDEGRHSGTSEVHGQEFKARPPACWMFSPFNLISLNVYYLLKLLTSLSASDHQLITHSRAYPTLPNFTWASLEGFKHH
jgi:hypothetical protein